MLFMLGKVLKEARWHHEGVANWKLISFIDFVLYIKNVNNKIDGKTSE